MILPPGLTMGEALKALHRTALAPSVCVGTVCIGGGGGGGYGSTLDYTIPDGTIRSDCLDSRLVVQEIGKPPRPVFTCRYCGGSHWDTKDRCSGCGGPR